MANYKAVAVALIMAREALATYEDHSIQGDANWYPYNVDRWAESVSHHHETCRDGSSQSPIALPECTSAPQARPPLALAWGVREAVLSHLGHAIELEAIAGQHQTTLVNGVSYTLRQCHFHTASEHFVGGEQPPMETHCVHTKDDHGGEYGVLGIFWDVAMGSSASDNVLAGFEDVLPELYADSVTVSVDFSRLVEGLDLTHYWSYRGSFTTPPCTEVVDWFNIMQHKSLGFLQAAKFVQANGEDGFNFRPPQPVNGRCVLGCTSCTEQYIDHANEPSSGRHGSHDDHESADHASTNDQDGGDDHVSANDNGSADHSSTNDHSSGDSSDNHSSVGDHGSADDHGSGDHGSTDSHASRDQSSTENHGPTDDRGSGDLGTGHSSGDHGAEHQCICSSGDWYPYCAACWSDAGDVPDHDELCMYGRQQSPIDLKICMVLASSSALGLNWGSALVTVSNTGHSISVGLPSTEIETTVRGNRYVLQQCHFRVGSEHTLGSEQQPMETQCVHSTTSAGHAGYAVVGIVWSLGEIRNPFLASIEDTLPDPSDPDSQVTVNFDLLLDGADGTQYWNYDGSLTTPPCTETVEWWVLMHRPTLTQPQLDRFSDAIGWGNAGGNFRPPQSLGERSVTGCDELPFDGGCDCVAVTYPDATVVPAQCGTHMGDPYPWCYVSERAESCGASTTVLASTRISGANFKYCPQGTFAEDSGLVSLAWRNPAALALATGAAGLLA